jgi:hypothetical protein
MQGDIQAAWDILQVLIIAGFTIGVVFAVIFAAIKIGWKLAPWVFVGAALLWFFGG